METAKTSQQEEEICANEEVPRNGVLTLCLPSLDDKDPLFSEKKRLSHARKLYFKFQLLPSSPIGELLEILDKIVRAARILFLNDVEIYFIEDDDFGPFSPRNELESLNAVLQILISMLSGAYTDETEALNELVNATIAKINSIADHNIDKVINDKFDTTAEAQLIKWGESHGARSKVRIAYFEEAGRGAVALEDINVGEVVLEIPESIIISEDLIHESDVFYVLKNWNGVTTDTMLLLWSMRERYNPLSDFNSYFDTLPDSFNTGLSFGIDALTILHGTLIFEELVQAKEANEDTERALLETIISIFEPMMEGLEDSNNLNREDLRWDVKLALDYKALQRRIISSVLSSCAAGLKTLGST